MRGSSIELTDLRRFPLFADLPEQELRVTSGLLRMKNFARRELVCRKDDAADGLYMLFSGMLQAVDIAEDGREIGLNLIKPGSFFGELSVIDGQPRTAHVLAQQMPGGLIAIQNLPKQQEIAIMINTSRDTVSRAIAHLVQMGVIEKDFR